MGGAVAGIALVCLLGAPFVVGLAEVWHILLFLVGLILLIVELAFTPSFGLLGVAGLAMILLVVLHVLGRLPYFRKQITSSKAPLSRWKLACQTKATSITTPQPPPPSCTPTLNHRLG